MKNLILAGLLVFSTTLLSIPQSLSAIEAVPNKSSIFSGRDDLNNLLEAIAEATKSHGVFVYFDWKEETRRDEIANTKEVDSEHLVKYVEDMATSILDDSEATKNLIAKGIADLRVAVKDMKFDYAFIATRNQIEQNIKTYYVMPETNKQIVFEEIWQD